jgi:hypothetical protein
MQKNLSGSTQGLIEEMLSGSVAGTINFESGGGSNVTITPTLESGTKIADFTIDENEGALYAPTPEPPIEYTAGANIQISEENVISATDTTYTAGNNITIDNGVISASGGSGLNYSTDEQMVGTWINGKPIYQKTFNVNISLTSGWTETNLYIPNLDAVIKCEVVRNKETGTSAFGAISVNIDIDRETKRIDIFNLRTISLDVTSITIWYTKSTDTVEND